MWPKLTQPHLCGQAAGLAAVDGVWFEVLHQRTIRSSRNTPFWIKHRQSTALHFLLQWLRSPKYEEYVGGQNGITHLGREQHIRATSLPNTWTTKIGWKLGVRREMNESISVPQNLARKKPLPYSKSAIQTWKSSQDFFEGANWICSFLDLASFYFAVSLKLI